MVDWGFAVQIAMFGFLTVFVVLGILFFILWFLGLIICKITGKQNNKGIKGSG